MNLASLTTSDWQARAAGVRYETRHFIDGKFVDSVAKGRFTVVNPATGAPLCEVSAGTVGGYRSGGGRGQAHLYVASLEPHGAARSHGRAGRVRRLIEENTERFALLDTLCMGKPISDMVNIDVPAAAKNFAYFGELIDKIDGRDRHRGGCLSLHLARAARRGGLHRAVELSVVDGRLESRSCVGGGQFGGVEAGRAIAFVRPADGVNCSSRRAARPACSTW